MTAPFVSLADRLRGHAEGDEQKRAFTFLSNGENEGSHLTYGEMHRRVRTLADVLAAAAAPGDRALLLYPPGLEFVCAFLACLQSGIVAVPAPVPRPNRRRRALGRVQGMADDAQPRLVLTTEAVRARLDLIPPAAAAGATLETIATDAIPDADTLRPLDFTVHANAMAFLQYTSGSTGDPKGTMVSHANLDHNLRIITDTTRLTPDSICVSWLPAFHDMGLIANILQTVHVGMSCVLMPPEAFLQRPARWVEAMSRYRATYSGGPNFAYQLCVDTVEDQTRRALDLTRWVTAFTGAEPVRAATLDRFSEAFAAAGFRRRAYVPCFGLAEGTLVVTIPGRDVEPPTLHLSAGALERGRVMLDEGGRPAVGCGAPRLGQAVAIVDPETRRRCPSGTVGEIWTAGPSVALGYWGRPQETEETFQARLSDSTEGPFLRTGDLGFEHEGDLFVTGRIKDLIIVRGRNLYPQDIEACAEAAHPLLVPGFSAAFALEVDGEERVGIVAEAARSARHDGAEEAMAAIRRAVAEEHEVQVHAVALLERGALPRTTSGKVQRAAARAGFREGTLREIARWSSPTEGPGPRPAAVTVAADGSADGIQAWMTRRLAQRLSCGVEEIDPRRPLAEYGLDSRALVELSSDLQAWLARPIPPHLLYSHPTIDALARHLARPDGAGGRTEEGTAALDAVAIVGIGCRFPGGAESPEAYWDLLRRGGVALSDVPPDRWDVEAFFDPDPDAPGKMYTRRGGFLDGIDRFDAAFFGIAPREAASLDPQQRMVLEVAWEALERAGIPAARLEGTRTGVFLGISMGDNGDRLIQPALRPAIDAYTGTGSSVSFAAGRLAYHLGLRGPALSVDTVCSSSLVALHLAVQSLRDGECDAALAGGVNAILTPETTICMCRLHALSASGHCRPFTAAADGYVRSEGCGMAILKRLSDARRDGDPIVAVIRGTAVNHDGRSNGLTAPSGPAHEEVIRAALTRARLSASDVDYVECHGTGTTLGDPIEVSALGAVYGEGRAVDRPLVIGAVKANLGHVEAAAGMAGLVKAVLALHHEEVPPQPPMGELSPHIDWERLPVVVARDLRPWPRRARPRRAGISAFGLSGTNAHVIVEEAPALATSASAPARSAEIAVLSARHPAALDAAAARLRDHLDAHAGLTLGDAAWSLATTRVHQPHRLAIVASSRETLRAALDEASRGGTPAGAARGRVAPAGPPRIAFVFSGQGSQWPGMGGALAGEEAAYRDALERCDAAIRAEAGWSVIDEIAATEDRDIDVVQPALFAMSVALAALWRAWGIEPDAVVGHSMGEVAAACVAGALTIEDGARVICRRSHLLRRIRGRGDMAMVELTAADAEAAIAPFADRLGIAAFNGPRSTVLSGEPRALAEVMGALEARGVFCRRVKVDVASHSPQVDELRAELLAALAGLSPRAVSIPMRSTVTGAALEGREVVAAYWADNLRRPVRFAQAVQDLLASGHGLFVEVSPHPLLVPALEEMRAQGGQRGVTVGSLRRSQDARTALLESMAALHVQGAPLRAAGLFPRGGRRVSLPTYAWQRERHWVDVPAPSATRPLSRPGAHPLLFADRTLSTRIDTRVWEGAIGVDTPPWLGDHRVHGSVVVPATAYLEMALVAGGRPRSGEASEVSGLVLAQPLVLAPHRIVPIQVVATEEGPGRLRLEIASAHDGDRGWVRHARAMVASRSAAARPDRIDVAGLRSRFAAGIAASDVYAALGRHGLEYGPAFRGIAELWRGEGEALGRIGLPEAAGSGEAYRLHPALLDACLQVAAFAVADADGTAWVPAAIGALRVHASPAGAELWSHARALAGNGAGADRRRFDVRIADAAGTLVAEVEGLVAQRLEASSPRREEDGWFVAVDWETRAVPAARHERARWLVLGDGAGLAARLRAVLENAGDTVRLEAADSGDLRALLAGAFAGTPPTGVIDLRALAAHDDEAAEPDALARGCRQSAALASTLMAMVWRNVPRLWVITRGAQAVAGDEDAAVAQAPLVGLRRAIALEHPELRPIAVDLDPRVPAEEAATLAAELRADDAEDEVAFRGGDRRVARLVRRPPAEAGERTVPAGTHAFRLESDRPGVLDALVLRARDRRPPAAGEVEIEVGASSLNFMDVMAAMGTLPGSEDALGLECAGRIVAIGEGVSGLAVGQEVVALGPLCLASHVTVPARMVRAVPPGLSLSEAAALPTAYMTAWHSLVEVARLREGERVLIHSATGGTGWAAVEIARRIGAEVFATAGSASKRAWLAARGITHVMDSRALTFADEVRAATGGEGVDVVLNSLSGPAIEAGLAALAPDGRFVEIGKADIHADRALGLAPFRGRLSYSAVDLAGLARRRPDRVAALFHEVMDKVAAGELPLLPWQALPMSHAAEALRTMAQARHVGKLVLTLPDPGAQVRVPETRAVGVRADATYLVTGGLGGLGLAVAEWLAARGARHLVLAGRSGAASAAQRSAVAALEASGVEVAVRTVDVADRKALAAVLASIPPARPLRGVVHAAGVLDDALLPEQTHERFRGVLAAKAAGAWNLHELTADAPLDFFVLYSSVAGLLGSPGQANHAAASAFLDALAAKRRASGRPALAIDWGTFAETGLAAAEENRGLRLERRGLRGLSRDEGLRVLERLLASPTTSIGVLPLDLRKWLEFYPAAASSRRLERLLSDSPVARPAGDDGLVATLLGEPLDARAARLEVFLAEQLVRVLRLSREQIDRDAPLTALGMDSLMGLELRNRIEAGLGLPLQATLLWRYPTLSALAAHLAEALGGAAPVSTVTPVVSVEVATAADTGAAGELDDAGVMALLDEELSRARQDPQA